MISVIDGVNERIECNAMKEWKLSILNIVDNFFILKTQISYPLNLNLPLDI